MAFPLVDLPKETIDHILSFRGLSPSVLLLWMTGDSRVHHALATGLSSIDLVNKNELVFCRFPKLLQNLRALRSLSVDRKSFSVPCMSGVRDTIRHLSPTLRKIKICVSGAGRFFATSSTQSVTSPPNEAEATHNGSSTTPLWTVKDAFPFLESLKLDSMFAFSASDLLDLPTSLMTLHTCLGGCGGAPGANESLDVVRADFARNLPQSLTELKAKGYGILLPEYEHLPPLLTRFTNVGYIYAPKSKIIEEIGKMPRSLTVGYDSLPKFPTIDQLAVYPPKLTSLDLRGLLSDSNDGKVGSDFDMGAIFSELKEIRSGFKGDGTGLIVTPKTLLSMPLTITTMKVRLNLATIHVDDWPKSLTKLEINPVVYPLLTEALPRTLKHLAIYGFAGMRNNGLDTETIASLPRSLLSLDSLCENVTDDVDFPPNLTRLSLRRTADAWCAVEHEDSGEIPNEAWSEWPGQTFDVDQASHLSLINPRPKLIRSFPFEKIPKSVVELQLGCSIPASKLKLLPRHLTLLTAISIFEDADFDPSSAEEVDALREIRAADDTGDVSSKTDLSASFDNTAAMVARLPRNIKHLNIHSEAFNKNASNDWYRVLPQRIEKLFLFGDLEGEFVHQAPLQHIKYITITLKQPKDEDIRALPRTPSFIETSDGSQLTHMAAAYWPPIKTTRTEDFRVTEWLSALMQKRRAHAGDEDPTELRKLYGTDPEGFEFLPHLTNTMTIQRMMRANPRRNPSRK